MYEHPYYIGDGNCDDETNNEGCSYDGGDCCGSNVNTQDCTECICYADIDCAAPLNLIGNGFCNDEANTAGCNYDGGDCCIASLSLIGDGYCDDEANTAECTYDGGDCCGDCVNTDFCTACICHLGGEPAIDLSCKFLMIHT